MKLTTKGRYAVLALTEIALSEDKNLINRATKGVYELGSVFKTFTYAAGLNEGSIDPDTEFKNLKKKIYCSNFVIGEYDDEIPSDLTAEQILIRSGNIGSIRIAQKVGLEKFPKFLNDLGLLNTLDFDIEEIGSPLKFKWGKCKLATASFGHGITTTPLQLAKAYDILGNGGYKIDPFILKDMEKAVSRTIKAINRNEKIGIFGDYDVDGATSTALLAKYFLSIKQKIKTYIPERKTEGYGPTAKSFKNLINNGVKLIFTVDCGTLSYEPINIAKEKKVDVIVLDHHKSDTILPNAHAIVNPNRFDDNSKLNYLCAAGVCFVFLVALNNKLREENWFKTNKIDEPNILDFLDLVSLGTVCDVVPLIGLNRAIVKQGLKVIKSRSNLGLKTLYDLSKINLAQTFWKELKA